MTQHDLSSMTDISRSPGMALKKSATQKLDDGTNSFGGLQRQEESECSDWGLEDPSTADNSKRTIVKSNWVSRLAMDRLSLKTVDSQGKKQIDGLDVDQQTGGCFSCFAFRKPKK
jgi:hypothetical protein